MATKLPPADRKQQILDAALALSARMGYQNITREAVAVECGVSHALVNLYFVVMAELKAAVVAEAVRVRNLAVLAQALAARDGAVADLDPKLKKQALASLNA